MSHPPCPSPIISFFRGLTTGSSPGLLPCSFLKKTCSPQSSKGPLSMPSVPRLPQENSLSTSSSRSLPVLVEGLKDIHALDIIHADIKADNVLFLGPGTTEIEGTVAKEPTLADGTFESEGAQYPFFGRSPSSPKFHGMLLLSYRKPFRWYSAILVLLCGRTGRNLREISVHVHCVPPRIGSYGLSVTYELLTGHIPLSPSHALTGETLKGSVIEKPQLKDQYFDSEGNPAKSKMNPYPRQTL
ncbi:hypothetical protein F5887DRAFT_256253 [Amanita rubescens]|nr:hypothetical protein F5887DRAFT_256253 [Amanita rubescens]